MNSQLEQGEKNQAIITMEIPVEEMTLAFKKASKKIAEKVNIPGFRKGKAPQIILENFVGVEPILEEAADIIFPEIYVNALKEHDLDPVDKPKIETLQLEKDKPMIFKATVTVKPQVELGQYKELPVAKTVYTVTDEDVEEELIVMRGRLSDMVDAPEGAVLEAGNMSDINFEGFVDGVAFEGGKGENYSLEIGSGTFIPGFEEQLIGMKVGEEKDINVTFPDEYQGGELAGKAAIFKVRLNNIRYKQMPPLNDDFVKEVSETAETLDQLRAEIKEGMKKGMDQKAEEACRSLCLQKAVDNAKVDIPSIMFEHRLDDIIEDLDHKIQAQGLDLKKYLEYSNQKMEDFRAEYSEQAEREVKLDLVLEAVIKAEKIEATDEDINEQLAFLSQRYHQPVEDIKKALAKNNQMSAIEYNIKVRKAGDLIYQAAKIEEEAYVKPQADADTEEKTTKKAKKTAEKASKSEAKTTDEKPVKKAAKKTTKNEEAKEE